MDHFHVTLEGFPADSGYVISKDGEAIGTYTCDDNDVCTFTPDGSDSPIISDTMIGPFCRKISEWHRKQAT